MVKRLGRGRRLGGRILMLGMKRRLWSKLEKRRGLLGEYGYRQVGI
jgi:hypothetical protein